MSARVGSLFVPASQLERFLGQFVLNLTVWNDDEVHKLSLIGSATPVRYAGRYFLICSRHQITGVDPEKICVLFPDGSIAVSSSGIRSFFESEETKLSDACDLAAFDFTEPCQKYPELKRFFFDFSTIPPDVTNVEVVAFISVGYPSSEQTYELEEKNHIGTLKRILTSELDSQPSDLAVLKAKYVRELEFAPDGLSGGPVFAVLLLNGEFIVYLAGMVVRSGKSSYYFVKSVFLRELIEKFISYPNQQA